MEQVKQMINRIIVQKVGMQNTWKIKFPIIIIDSNLKLMIDKFIGLKKDFTARTNLLSKNLFIIVDVLIQNYKKLILFPNIYLSTKNHLELNCI